MGEIVLVKDGFGRNYLLPRSLAVAATGGAMEDHAARLTREKERTAKQLSSAQEGGSKLDGLTITIIGKVGSGTKLYGSVTAQDVADAIERERKVTVDKRRVGLVEPIKTLGTYTIPVRLHSDVIVPVTLEVMTEEEVARRKVQAEAAEAKAAAEAAAAAATAAAEPLARAEGEPVAASVAKEEAGTATAAEAAPVLAPAAIEEETPAEAETGPAADGAAEDSAE